MAHKDIYTKFMIEYDKANVTSSYPSLTQFEVATLLDKAYDSVVDRKFTGLNNRKSFFESDIKSIQDLQPLVIKSLIAFNTRPLGSFDPANVRYANLPEDMKYFIAAGIHLPINDDAAILNGDTETAVSKYVSASLVTHRIAENFFDSATNNPWIKHPVCFIENNQIGIVADSNRTVNPESVLLTYLRKHNPFVKNLEEITNVVKNNINQQVGNFSIDSQIYLSFYVEKYGCDVFDTEDQYDGYYYMTNDNGIYLDNVRAERYYTLHMVVDDNVDESLISVYDLFEKRPYKENGEWVRQSYTIDGVEYVVDSGFKGHSGAKSNDHATIVPGKKLIACAFKVAYDANEPSMVTSVFTETSYVFSVKYLNLKLVMIDRGLLTKPMFIYPEYYSSGEEIDPTQDPESVKYEKYDLLPVGSFSLLYHTDLDKAYFDSVTNRDVMSSIVTIDQSATLNDIMSSFEFGYFDYKVKRGYECYLRFVTIQDLYTFELSDSMASEVISTAITYALDNVESTRLQSHSSLMTLEA